MRVVTLEQAKELKHLGYQDKVLNFYRLDNHNKLTKSLKGSFNANLSNNAVSAPYVADVFDWFRSKGISVDIKTDWDLGDKTFRYTFDLWCHIGPHKFEQTFKSGKPYHDSSIAINWIDYNKCEEVSIDCALLMMNQYKDTLYELNNGKI